MNVAGVVTTLVGSVSGSGYADGVGTSASFFRPAGLVASANGFIYVCDNGNNRIRQISTNGEHDLILVVVIGN